MNLLQVHIVFVKLNKWDNVGHYMLIYGETLLKKFDQTFNYLTADSCGTAFVSDE